MSLFGTCTRGCLSKNCEPVAEITSMRQPTRVTYKINRKIYNEEEFQQDHDQRIYSQTDKDFVPTQGRRKIQCRFSWERFRKIMLKMFPILNWMWSYHITEWFLRDVHAGISVGMVQLLQGLSAVLLTGLPLPAVNGFYSAFFSTLTYVIFGTSHHISIGSFTILNAMIANFQTTLNFNVTLPSDGMLANTSDDKSVKIYMEAVTLTASTTFLVGIIQLLLGFVGVGYVTTYLSETLINAYLTAAALHVIVSQFSFIFGIVIDFHSGPLAIFYNLIHYCMGLPKANSTSILLFLLALVMLRVSKCIKITYKHSPVEFPMELLLIIVCTIISTQIQWHAESSLGIFAMVPYRFLPPTLPDFSKLYKIVLHALSLAIVSYFLLIFVGKKYATIHNYHLRNTQDLLAIGLCNVFGSFFKSFVVSCAVSATVIQEKTGGKTQLAALIGASIMLVTVLKLGRYFQSLPNAVLAAIVMANMFPFLEKFVDVPSLWRQDKYDFGIWIVTFLAVLCLGLDIGLGIAMGFAFFIISVRSHRMKMLMLGQIPNTNIYRSFSDYGEATEIQGVRIFQCCSSISSANMKHFKDYVLRKMDMKAVRLDENEMRALISVSLSSVRAQNKDLQCACVCDPPEPLPRVPYTEKLVRRTNTSNESSSSSLALVRLTRIANKYSSNIQTMPPPVAREREAGHDTVNRKEDLSRLWFYSDPPVTRSTTQLFPLDSESSTYLIHTIILDFSMVHFVDLQASYLLRELCNVFQNIGITVLIAACHPTVIKAFERNEFFDQCVTKARFFPTLHDAVLFAVEPEPLQQTAAMGPCDTVPEETLDEIHSQKDRSQHSDRSRQSDGRSQQSDGNRDAHSVKAVRSETYADEPISDLFRTFSLQSDVDTVPHPHLEMSPLEEMDNDQKWELYK
ncbi:testis anion transporter 1 [Sphaerodactylus townsendi]|uniref:testis anion transporter 1 n=1 Tax=Sphaerodactylus townsendi TaxID=933632 RepID=UPI002026F5BE|nr:testis anion transporter 1 [Sphaerodactylus townsendi]